jgi:hypothetical protein
MRIYATWREAIGYAGSYRARGIDKAKQMKMCERHTIMKVSRIDQQEVYILFL